MSSVPTSSTTPGVTKTVPVSAAPAPAVLAAPEPIPFTVLSYNVNFGSCYDDDMKVGDNTNAPHVLRAIAESKADIVCLQETHGGWEKAARAHLSELYPNQIWRHPNSGYYASGLALLWTNKHALISESLFQPKVEGSFFPGQRATFALNAGGTKPAGTGSGGSGSGGASASTAAAAAAAAVIIDTKTIPTGSAAGTGDLKSDEKQKAGDSKSSSTKAAAQQNLMEIVNVHLRPPLPMGNGSLLSFKTISAYLWETTAVRTQELGAFVSQFGMRRPHLLVGDCNEGSTGSAVSWMLGSGYNDALTQANTQTTWYWPIPLGLELWGSYDHLFYSHDTVACTGAVVYEAYKHASDHLPVKGSFVLHPKKAAPPSATAAAAAANKPKSFHS